MPEIMKRYSQKIKGNMCSCPFHKDVNPSMKLFKDGAKCFSCGWSGDIFKLIMDVDNCDFKTAYKSLGGTYEHSSNKGLEIANTMRRGIHKADKDRQKNADRELFDTLILAIKVCRLVKEIYEPFSDGWCEAANRLPFLEYAYELKFIKQQRIDEVDVYRISRQINKRFL